MTMQVLALVLACTLTDGTRRPMVFSDINYETVASLVYDEERALCRCEGDMDAAFRIVWQNFHDVAEERDRLKWGNAQVDRWNAKARGRR